MASTRNAPKTEKRSPVALTPPAVSRERESSADLDIVNGIAAILQADDYDGSWQGTGDLHDEKRDANNQAVVYRRSVIRAMGGDPAVKGDAVGRLIRSKTWKDPESGKFLFGLSKRTSASAAEPTADES